MQWSNWFLAPIVVGGGLIAFLFGRTIIGGLIRAFGRATAHTPVSAPAIAPPVVQQSTTIAPSPSWDDLRPRRTMELSQRSKSLAERKEELIERLLTADATQNALDMALKQQDEEEVRRLKLLDDARKRSRSNNVLVGKLDVPATAGPMTQHIAMTEDYLATLKAAAAKRDTIPK